MECLPLPLNRSRRWRPRSRRRAASPSRSRAPPTDFAPTTARSIPARRSSGGEIRSHSTAFTKGLDIIGIRQNQPQFNFVDDGPGSTAITPPRWAPILRCAGYIQTVGGSSVTYDPPAIRPMSWRLPTATISTEMDGTLKQHVGTQAESFTITAEAGGPWTAAFRGRGDLCRHHARIDYGGGAVARTCRARGSRPQRRAPPARLRPTAARCMCRSPMR